MKRWIAALVLGGGLAAVWFLASNQPPKSMADAPEKTAAQFAAVSNALAGLNPDKAALIQSNFARVQPAEEAIASAVPNSLPPSGAPLPLEVTNIPPDIILQNVTRAIRQYGKMFGGNPVGTNPEITSQLSGNNPKHINFIQPEAGMRIDAQGALIDPWGTPFFLHQLSSADMEIRSAGPDRVMWTSDDLDLK